MGPKVAPKRVRTAKTTSNKVAGGVRAAKVRPARLDCLSELWKPGANQAEISANQILRSAKSMYTTSHMIRSSIYIYIYMD